MTSTDIYQDNRTDDLILPFQIGPFGLRGRSVRLGAVVDEVIRRHGYPEPVNRLLAETITLAGCLAGALKYDGIFTLQAKGAGPVRTVVADVTSAGDVRAYAGFDADMIAAAKAVADDGNASVPGLLGEGYLAFTVDQGQHTERYQGIVAFEGETLTDCARAYFRESEQIEAGLHLATAAPRNGGGWRAAAMMVQRLPFEGGESVPKDITLEDYEDGWRRAMVMMASAKASELLDPSLPADRLLYRLFHEDGVRAYPSQALQPGCRCSAEKVENVLVSLVPAELLELLIDGHAEVTCEFCKSDYRYSEKEIARMRSERQMAKSS
jgi:molecular chaperone Hsp33